MPGDSVDAPPAQPPAELSPRHQWDWYRTQRRLAYQVAADGASVFPPRRVDPTDGVGRMRWSLSAGRGTVYAETTVPGREGGARRLVLVELDEGFRMLSRLEGAEGEGSVVGARVAVAFVDGDADEPPLPVFVLWAAVFVL